MAAPGYTSQSAEALILQGPIGLYVLELRQVVKTDSFVFKFIIFTVGLRYILLSIIFHLLFSDFKKPPQLFPL